MTTKAEAEKVVKGIRRAMDECPNEEIFGSLGDARRKLAMWRYDCKGIRPHPSLGKKTPR